MNIAFFLIPKKEVIFLTPETTMRQALEKMEHHRYTAVPLVDKQGRYVGTITEGDLLWKMKNTAGLTLSRMEKLLLKDIACKMKNVPVNIDAKIVDLLTIASEQNFVPVVDGQGVFIGIVRRREIIAYCVKLIEEKDGAFSSSHSNSS